MPESGSFASAWKIFWDAGQIGGTTVNFIDTPQFGAVSFMAIIWAVLILGTISATISRKSPKKGGLFGGFLAASFIAAVIFTVRMEFTWHTWWRHSVDTFASLPEDRRIAAIDAEPYLFVEELKKLLPQDAMVRLFSTVIFDREKIAYYLLPVKISAKERIFVFYKDKGVRYDHSAATLTRNGSLIADRVVLIKAFTPDTFICKAEGMNP